MSESQRRVTGTFQAADDGGNQYHVVEYTDFRHTTDAEMQLSDEGIKEYELSNGAPLKKIGESEFEIVSGGAKIRRV